MSSRKKVMLKARLAPPQTPYQSTNRAQVIILGDSGVGKTSLMNQYVRIPPSHLPRAPHAHRPL
jgi:GTPase SAR1 family protein